MWVGSRKIASIGVAVRRWVAWHGFALNVGRDLDGFLPITPCGISGVAMTSVGREGGPEDVARVIPAVVSCFVEMFSYETTRPLDADVRMEPWPGPS